MDDKLILVRRLLLDALVEEHTIAGILDSVSEIMDNPIIAADATYRLLGCSPRRLLNDGVWDNLLKRGFVEQGHVMMFDMDRTHAVLTRSDEPVYLNWGFAKDMPRLSSKIGSGEHVFGYLGILEYNHPFGPLDYEIAGMLSKVLLNETGCTSGMMTALHDELFMKIANLQVLPHSGNLILFLYGSRIAESLQAAGGLMCRHSMEGSCDFFAELLDAHIYHRQALIALDIGRNTEQNKGVYTYRDYSEAHFIASVLKENDPGLFMSPELQALLDYDAANESELAFTLHAYLRSYKNASATSQQLHVHRNTLAYRLKKCEEVAGLDLGDEAFCRYI